MRVAIIDDERVEREKLQGFLNQFAEEFSKKIEIFTYTSGDELLSQYESKYDILIFDVDMPGTNGIDTARKIREMDQNVVILFVTNIAQYAINGYEVEAVDYVIKPIGYFDFSMKFQKAVSKAEQRKDKKIALDTVDGMRKLLVSELCYVEVFSHYLIYHTKDEQYKVRGSMKEHEMELIPYGFCRIHKSYLVSLGHVEEIRKNEVVIGTEVLPIGRVFKENLMQEFLKYIRG